MLSVLFSSVGWSMHFLFPSQASNSNHNIKCQLLNPAGIRVKSRVGWILLIFWNISLIFLVMANWSPQRWQLTKMTSTSRIISPHHLPCFESVQLLSLVTFPPHPWESPNRQTKLPTSPSCWGCGDYSGFKCWSLHVAVFVWLGGLAMVIGGPQLLLWFGTSPKQNKILSNQGVLQQEDVKFILERQC